MPLQKLTFKPGVNRENTRYTNEGGWWDMSAVRFRSGTPEKIGGWVELSANTFLGVARFLHNWDTLGRENLLAVGTNLKMYIERGGAYFDITPIRYAVTGLGIPFHTTSGLDILDVTVIAHGAIAGDFVTFSGVSADVNGVLATTLNAEFQIISIISADIFTIRATVASGTGDGGGGAVNADFQVTTGPEISVSGVGYGVGAWGIGGWGEAASGTGVITTGMRQWVGGNFGQDLIFAIRDGGVFYWSADGSISSMLATRGVALSSIVGASDAPTIADNLFVTDDQHVVAVGTNALGTTDEDPMLIRWCAQGNPLNWTPGVTNTAGDYRLSHGSYTYASAVMRQENLIWTDASVVSMQFVGPPVVFSFTTLATNTSIASTSAVVVANNIAYWMGKDKFYVYNGLVQTLPCTVRKYVFSNINMSQIEQVVGGGSAQYNEVTWFYCSLGQTVIDRYVTYNYAENIWTFGAMSRTAWLDSPLRETPIAAATNNKLYYHEVGLDDGTTSPTSAIYAYLESADFDIGDGQNYSFVDRIIPDVEFEGSTVADAAVTLTLQARSSPGTNFSQTNARTVAQTAILPFYQHTEQLWTRIRGRQMTFRIESNATGVAWQLGTPRLGIREDGQR